MCIREILCVHWMGRIGMMGRCMGMMTRMGLDRWVRRIVRRNGLRLLRWWSLELGNMRSHDLGFPFLRGRVSDGLRHNIGYTGRYGAYVLQFCKDVFADTILIEFGLNARDNVVNDGAIYSRLMLCAWMYSTGTGQGRRGDVNIGRDTHSTQRHALEQLDTMAGE